MSTTDAPKPPRETTPEGCTIERFTVHSPAMGRDIQAAAVLPLEYESHPDKKYPVLYAFHGSDAPYDTYQAIPGLRAALCDKPMIVVSLDGDANSGYLDAPTLMEHGRKYLPGGLVKSLFTTFFFKEFIPPLDAKYRIDSAKRMLTGFSMGGFGAMHYMLEAPEKFVSVSSMSGWFPDWSSTPDKNFASFTEPMVGTYETSAARYQSLDLKSRMKKHLSAGAKIPPIYLMCGTGDYLLPHNHDFRDFLNAQGVKNKYLEDSGDHTWPYWRDHGASTIDFHWSTLPK